MKSENILIATWCHIVKHRQKWKKEFWSQFQLCLKSRCPQAPSQKSITANIFFLFLKFPESICVCPQSTWMGHLLGYQTPTSSYPKKESDPSSAAIHRQVISFLFQWHAVLVWGLIPPWPNIAQCVIAVQNSCFISRLFPVLANALC